MVGGDSAGGNLAAVVALAARDGNGPKLAGQVLIYPATDFSMKHPSHSRAGDQPPADAFGRSDGSPTTISDGADSNDWRASPARAKTLTGLPPAYVLTAGADPLRDEGDEYAERLKQAGVAVDLPALSRPIPRLLHHGQIAAAGQCRGERNRRLAEGAELNGRAHPPKFSCGIVANRTRARLCVGGVRRHSAHRARVETRRLQLGYLAYVVGFFVMLAILGWHPDARLK